MKSKVQDQTTRLIEKLRHACSVALGDLLALGMPAGASTGKLLLEAITAAEKEIAEAASLPLPPGWQLVDDRMYVFAPSRDRDFRVPSGWRLVDAYIGLVDTRPDHSRMQLPGGLVDVVLPSGALLPIGGLVPSDVDVVKAGTPNMTGGVSNWAGIQLVFEESVETAKEAPATNNVCGHKLAGSGICYLPCQKPAGHGGNHFAEDDDIAVNWDDVGFTSGGPKGPVRWFD